ncbi:MAG: tRNA (adenosine(37)-N6)-threonylcarbamoyltransferase complex dimerization subunit type 1 TsaB [Chloroflexi bacterium]|nr:tRNA (adenosine(37)-N6)-threonylcarbamoyltransferase complex dimerization subunit type 1 TsaB [Chloroflexota bacterium]
MELSIDTSTDWGGIALSLEGRLIADLTWHSGQNQTTELAPNIRRLMETAAIDFTALTAIFVARGPGSYNGLRAGISAAKGFAFSLSIPLVSISTLEVEAYPFAFTELPICPVYDAGRGEIATALFILRNEWQCIEAEHLTTLTGLCAETHSTTVFCGGINPEQISQIKQNLGEKAVIPDWQVRVRQPGSLAVLGWQRLHSGQYDNPATLQPVYLRQPPITLRKKKY